MKDNKISHPIDGWFEFMVFWIIPLLIIICIATAVVIPFCKTRWAPENHCDALCRDNITERLYVCDNADCSNYKCICLNENITTHWTCL